MVKAIFLDYTGTMVREDDPYTQELIRLFITYSKVKDVKKLYAEVWGMIKKIEFEHYKDTFVKKDEMVDMILEYSVKHYGLDYDLDKIHEVWRNSWIYAPVFDDVKPFIERMDVPIYIITNDDLDYVTMSLEDKDIQVAGIISSEMVKACKPHREILDKALEVANVSKEDVVLIGDSITSDVNCALEVGIKPILLDRKKQVERQDITVIHSLDEFVL